MTRRARHRPLGFLVLVAVVAACDGAGALSGQQPGPMTEPDAGPAPAGYIGMLPTTARPYRLVRGRGDSPGAPMRLSDLVSEMSDADAVCLGEQHDDPNSHAVQLMVLDLFTIQAARAGHGRALGMEMFELPFQSVLDDYIAGAIDEATMLLRTQWVQRWGYDFGMYRPLVDRMLEAQGSLRALNAAAEIVKKIGEQGIDSLTDAERAQLPELDLASAEHRAWFERTVSGLGAHGGVTVANSYVAQVVRDETMAQTAWSWLSAQPASPRQLAIAAGTGHCIDLAIPMRLRRRGAHKVLSVRPLPQEALADTLAEGLSDVLVIFAP